ncbi:MAG: cupin domain-containing protein [Synergistaceae bacterium]|jgi:N-acetylneuraminate synthase|nr:cupin domain-containing protein [Synergistaceae bacterium]
MENEQVMIKSFIDSVKEYLRKSYVVLPKKAEVKLYHHYGIDSIVSTGAAFISVIQHDYCKFIVIMTPGQSYPLHYHRIKDESYFILYGDLKVTIEDGTYFLTKGDIINVPRLFMHGFSTESGCVFEEISTAYLQNDSVYENKEIQYASKSNRSTVFSIEAFVEERNGDDGKQ